MKQSTNIFEQYYVDLMHSDFEKRLAVALQKDGLVTFDHIRSREHLVIFSRLLGTVFHHRDSEADGVTRVANTGEIATGEGFAGFSSSALTFHTDRSSALEPPTIILLLCSIQAQEGGASLLADAREIWEVLQTEYPDTLEKLSAPRSAIFMGSKQPLISSIFATQTGGNIVARFRYDNLGYFSPAVISALPTFFQVLEQRSITFTLSEGQGYMVQNGRWLHGRTSFRGKREMFRLLVNTTDEAPIGKKIRPGFRAEPSALVKPLRRKYQ